MKRGGFQSTVPSASCSEEGKPLHILVFLTVLAVQGHIGEILSEKFRFKIKRKLKDSKRV